MLHEVYRRQSRLHMIVRWPRTHDAMNEWNRRWPIVCVCVNARVCVFVYMCAWARLCVSLLPISYTDSFPPNARQGMRRNHACAVKALFITTASSFYYNLQNLTFLCLKLETTDLHTWEWITMKLLTKSTSLHDFRIKFHFFAPLPSQCKSFKNLTSTAGMFCWSCICHMVSITDRTAYGLRKK